MKKRVEDQFEDDMEDVCNSKNWFQKLPCRGAAKAYKLAVRCWWKNKATDPNTL